MGYYIAGFYYLDEKNLLALIHYLECLYNGDIGAQFKVDLTGKIKSATLVTNESAVNSFRYVFRYDEEGKLDWL